MNFAPFNVTPEIKYVFIVRCYGHLHHCFVALGEDCNKTKCTWALQKVGYNLKYIKRENKFQKKMLFVSYIYSN